MNSSILLDIIPQDLQSKEGKHNFDPCSVPLIGVYFSAHWCGPCKAFTPMLSSFYEAANKEKKQIEIVFVSLDKDQGQFNSYFSTMPWLSVPFENSESRELLQDTYGIQGIPTFLVFDKTGKCIDQKGRMTVANRYPKNGYDPQRAQTVINIWNGIQP